MLSAGPRRTKNASSANCPFLSTPWTCRRFAIGLYAREQNTSRSRCAISASLWVTCAWRTLPHNFRSWLSEPLLTPPPVPGSPSLLTHPTVTCKHITYVYNIHKSILYVRLYHTVRGINAPGSPNLPKTAKKPKWAYPNVLARRFDRYHIENPLSRLNRPAPRGHFGPPGRPKSILTLAVVFLRCVIQRTCNSLILHINVCNSMLLRPLRLRLAPA